MAKETRTVSIDEDIDKRLAEDPSLNASAIVNELLRLYLEAGRAPDVALTFRKKELENNLEKHNREQAGIESTIENLERELSEVEDMIKERRNKSVKEAERVADQIIDGGMRREQLNPENEAIQHWAGKAHMTPERFIKEVKGELND